jgi:hypothetical protein
MKSEVRGVSQRTQPLGGRFAGCGRHSCAAEERHLHGSEPHRRHRAMDQHGPT